MSGAAGAGGSDILREFLIRLGFQVDEQSHRKFSEGLAGLTKGLLGVGAAVASMAAAAVAGVQQVASGLESMYYVSQRSKSSVDNIKAFQFAMSQVGETAENARALVDTLGKAMNENIGLRSEFQAYTHVAYKDAVQGLDELGKLFAKMKAQGYDDAYIIKLGADFKLSQEQVQALMRDWKGFYAQYLADSENIVGSQQKLLPLALHLEQTYRSATNQMALFWQRFTDDLMPGVDKAMTKFDALMREHQKQIDGVIDGIVNGSLKFLGTAGKQIEDAGNQFEKVYNNIKEIIGKIALADPQAAAQTDKLTAALENFNIKGGQALTNFVNGPGEGYGAWLRKWVNESTQNSDGIIGKWLNMGGFNKEAWAKDTKTITDFFDGLSTKLTAVAGSSDSWKQTLIGLKDAAMPAFTEIGVKFDYLKTVVTEWKTELSELSTWISSFFKKSLTESFQELVTNIDNIIGHSLGLDTLKRMRDWFNGGGLGALFADSLAEGNKVQEPAPGQPVQSAVRTGWNRISRLFAYGKQPEITDQSFSPAEQAFLQTLSAPESGGDYNLYQGGGKFSGDQYPFGKGPNGTSSAKGRFMITDDTYRELSSETGIHHYDKVSQERLAMHLAEKEYRRYTGGRDLRADLNAGGHNADIVASLRGRWPSLPGGSQQLESQSQFDTTYSANLAADNRTSFSVPPSIGPAAASGGNTTDSHDQYHVNLVVGNNDPRDIAARVRQELSNANPDKVRNSLAPVN